jgi:hypothetical protein
VSDRHGVLPATPLIPYIGLFSVEDGHGPLSHEEAAEAFAGKSYAIRSTAGSADAVDRPQALASRELVSPAS